VSTAKRALIKVHCKLGKIITPHRQHGTLVVAAQNPPPGKQLPNGAAVSVRLGPRTTQH
jgi:hypothetical protein